MKGYSLNGEETVIQTSPPTVAMKKSTANILKAYLLTALKSGTGSSAYIEGIDAGGKTGTAQVGSNGSNNGLFVAFAPYDKPEIAVCVVLEHGVSGANAAYVAKDLFDYYFSDYKGEVLYAE